MNVIYVVFVMKQYRFRLVTSICVGYWHSGFPRLLESPGFLFVKFPGPGMPRKMGLVLESPGNFSERSWNFLGYDVGGGHNDAGADAIICIKLAKILSLYTTKHRWGS